MALKASTHWIQGIGFEVEVREHHQFTDGKKEFGGKDRGPSPKEYVLAGLCGCTGMDVVSLLKKYKVDFSEFSVSAQSEQTKTHPVVFTDLKVTFEVKGESLDVELVKKAVELSMTKYCGVSAMLSKAVPVNYEVKVNDQISATGVAKFE